jgi:ubiquinone/menaquinone biosynthesis C-methylase UbiE
VGAGPEPFDRDVELNEGYRYTTNAPLSSRLANDRLTDATLELVSLVGRSLIDVGCGDGAYTADLARRGNPSEIVGIDPSPRAVEVAARRHPGLRFEVGAAAWLEVSAECFDVAVARGVLHHADDPARLLRAIGRVAETVVVIEPNGWNPVLKVIERASAYHREHGERSWRSSVIDGWLREAGFVPATRMYAGLVPFFCPTPAARVLKALEPLVESSGPLGRAVLAVYAVRATRAVGDGGV